MRNAVWTALAVVLALALTACGGSAVRASRSDDPSPASSSARTSRSPSPSPADVAMARPAAFSGHLLSPDLLVYSSKTLTPQMVRRVQHLAGVARTLQFAMAQFYYHEVAVTYAAVDPSSFRDWAVGEVAESDPVWKRVADGEIAIDPALAARVAGHRAYVRMGDAASSPQVHIGAYAALFSPTTNLGIDAVVNQRWARPLGMVSGNAMLVSTGGRSPQSVEKALRVIVGRTASIRVLGFTFDPKTVQTAVLTGEAVNGAVGTYNYTATAGGRVIPDPAWVRRYIRTEQVPILGAVTCNKVMFSQLSGALTQIRRAGLAGDIHTYNGCFVPRYIAGSHQLSYHAFGLAIDIDAATNQRGTRGTMNPQVVSIFREWGFEWGGSWHYTDPMHFQLDRVVGGRAQSDP